MGLTSALNTSLNGLSLNETTIDVLGNNIANAGTNGFKASEALFATQLSRTLSVGSRPTDTNGGTNPRQIGLGANTTAIRKIFSQGSVTTSTSPSDLAIQGDGFFVVSAGGDQRFTRNGNFTLNSDDTLVNAQGMTVQGYGVDENFALIDTQLQSLEIPLGKLSIAQATRNIELSGALLSTGDLGTQGTAVLTDALTDAGNAGAPITAATLLSDVRQAGTPLFAAGDAVAFSPRKGGRLVDPQALNVAAASTVGDLVGLFDTTLGIHTGGGVGNDGNLGIPPGVTVTAAGEIRILGNIGTVNDIDVLLGDLVVNGSPSALGFTQTQQADGESTLTDVLAYDSLGEQVNIVVSAALESRTGSTTTFRWFADSPDDSDADTTLGSGTITFDSDGQVVEDPLTPAQASIVIDRNDTAAASPQTVTLDFSRISGISSVSSGSGLTLQSQDGSSPGTLTSFVIDEGGTINGIFDNGVIRTLGQVALGRFSNPQGLIEAGDTTFREGVGSGAPFIVSPGGFGSGTIRSGAIELSNTDIGKNLVDLIVASTNYRGNARVISSVQELVDELLILGR